MMMYLYTVQDKLAEECGPPFTAANNAVALRSFKKIVRDYDEKDYELLLLGSWNSKEAIIKPFDIPRVIQEGDEGPVQDPRKFGPETLPTIKSVREA